MGVGSLEVEVAVVCTSVPRGLPCPGNSRLMGSPVSPSLPASHPIPGPLDRSARHEDVAEPVAPQWSPLVLAKCQLAGLGQE